MFASLPDGHRRVHQDAYNAMRYGASIAMPRSLNMQEVAHGMSQVKGFVPYEGRPEFLQELLQQAGTECGSKGGCWATQRERVKVKWEYRPDGEVFRQDFEMEGAGGAYGRPPKRAINSHGTPAWEQVDVEPRSSRAWTPGVARKSGDEARAGAVAGLAGKSGDGKPMAIPGRRRDYVDEGYFYAYDTWADADIYLLDRAYEVLNNNIDYIEEWAVYEDTSIFDTSCVQDLISGSTSRGKSWIYPGDGTGCAAFDGDRNDIYQGCTIPGDVAIKLNKYFIRALREERSRTSCGTDDGACYCIDMEVAGLILHETVHSCLGGEDVAYLLSQYFRYRYVSDRDFTHDNCNCAWILPQKPGGGGSDISFNSEDFTKQQAKDAEDRVGHHWEGGDGHMDICPSRQTTNSSYGGWRS